LQHVAYSALGVSPAKVQRHFVQLVARQLRATQDKADLWAVAVAYGDVPTPLDHASDVDTGLAGCFVLIGHRLVLLVLDERIAADSNDSNSFVLSHYQDPP